MISTLGTIVHKSKVYKSRRAASVWISWVLLFAFVIGISAASYRFIVPLIEDATIDVKKVVFNTDECRQVGISVESVCHDITTQDLNITIRNRNYISVDKLRFQWFDAGNKPVSSESQTTKIGPNREKRYTVNSTTSSTLGFVKVVPVVFREGLEIICSEKAATSSEVSDC